MTNNHMYVHTKKGVDIGSMWGLIMSANENTPPVVSVQLSTLPHHSRFGTERSVTGARTKIMQKTGHTLTMEPAVGPSKRMTSIFMGTETIH